MGSCLHKGGDAPAPSPPADAGDVLGAEEGKEGGGDGDGDAGGGMPDTAPATAMVAVPVPSKLSQGTFTAFKAAAVVVDGAVDKRLVAICTLEVPMDRAVFDEHNVRVPLAELCHGLERKYKTSAYRVACIEVLGEVGAMEALAKARSALVVSMHDNAFVYRPGQQYVEDNVECVGQICGRGLYFFLHPRSAVSYGAMGNCASARVHGVSTRLQPGSVGKKAALYSVGLQPGDLMDCNGAECVVTRVDVLSHSADVQFVGRPSTVRVLLSDLRFPRTFGDRDFVSDMSAPTCSVCLRVMYDGGGDGNAEGGVVLDGCGCVMHVRCARESRDANMCLCCATPLAADGEGAGTGGLRVAGPV